MNGSRQQNVISPTVFDRELTWLQFNHRVQMEADNPDNPLLERAKFLSIVTSNLDEFMQVRYHTVLEAAAGISARKVLPCGLTAEERLKRVNKTILQQQNLQYLLYEGIYSELYHQGVQLFPLYPLNDEMQARVKEIFLRELLPRLKPIPWGEELIPLPQKRLHWLVRLHPRSGRGARYVSVALPGSQRLYELPSPGDARCLIRKEDLAKMFLPLLFPEDRVEEASMFRILRNQDFVMDEHGDVATVVREMLLKRRTGDVMRLEAEERMSAEMLAMLMKRFQVPPEHRYRVTGPLDLNKLMMSLYGTLDRPDLKYPRAEPVSIPALMGGEIFTQIAARDWFLYHPYHSFEPVINFLARAADDPDVCSVKMTLYRVGSSSPVVRALAKAAENGKQVTVLFEARARFDEENNLAQGERLRRAGCHVLYGIPALKTHSKTVLVSRMENGHLRRYLHLGTGNYHDGTARLYTDMCLFTADPQLGEDAARFFYGLEGSGPTFSLEQLVDAPGRLKTRLLSLIDREKQHALAGKASGIIAKMNSLLDAEIIAALYDAGRSGVHIRLIVRGICTLIPGVPRLSENIEIVSIVGRHLEHARAFRFENGGMPEYYLSSADWMPRNLVKRLELMFPLKDPACQRAVDSILALQLADNVKSWRLDSSGNYTRKHAVAATVNAQEILLANLGAVMTGQWQRGIPADARAE
ncbi:MAG: polyphosphate kinase 1 [Eubacteriales bacterium]|nr:polyphosphate kinase 1 [Eubacteriales bacterium]